MIWILCPMSLGFVAPEADVEDAGTQSKKFLIGFLHK
jgi:hypothetical protein